MPTFSAVLKSKLNNREDAFPILLIVVVSLIILYFLFNK